MSDVLGRKLRGEDLGVEPGKNFWKKKRVERFERAGLGERGGGGGRYSIIIDKWETNLMSRYARVCLIRRL